MTRMKESGIDWIGQIPEEWYLGKVKFFSKISAGATPDRNNIFFWNGDINWMSSGEVNQEVVTHTAETITTLALKRTSTKLLPIGTVMLALNGQGKTKGTAAVLAIETASNQSLASFIVDNAKVNNIYLYYFLKANYSNIRGLKGEDRDGLNLQLVSNIIIPLLDIKEQQKIADFLDKKTAQLDKVKSLLEEQIQKLKDYRASLIYETVTKGLDKTVPMKDSGIDWVGQVPEGWGVGKVKYFSQISAGATPDRNNSLFWNGNINWMSSGEVNQGIVKYTSETITDLALKRTSTKLLPNGTVMLALNGQGKTKGTAAVLAIESASNQSLASFIVDNKTLNNMYLYYFFVANYYNIRGLKGEDRDGLNLQLVSNIVIPLFEIEKQQKIVDFLDKKTVQIDKLIQIKNEQIKNINKQRQTLIYDYVTGKRRVY
ncbi:MULTISPECIES: restriction endonuclease subunit S [unclassified Streptococcus]|uniref:restriction endonuclease subunit S n=1 Tax=unclassified Streptococcus TaxID=2608887 RepID=UPI0015666D2D|nr:MULTISPECIES: restriction endonuclease subunit S [unclassified Streptococcus]